MASVTRRLLLPSSRGTPRICASARTSASTRQPWARPLSTSAPRHSDNDPSKSSPQDAAPTTADAAPARPPRTLSTKDAEEAWQATKGKRRYPVHRNPPKQSPEEQRVAALTELMSQLESLDPHVRKAAGDVEKSAAGQSLQVDSDDFELQRDEDFEVKKDLGRAGFWAEGEEELGPDEDFYGDDITSHGHGELEQHRELREYARLIAWELPLLHQLARPFELPDATSPFRFRYTSYLGEKHPATNKVVVEFSASDMRGLTDLQKSKLIKLAGPRYNPDSDIIKMSCELYDTQKQNKRFLGDTITKLLAEAKDDKETFADVPFDFRHHKPKVRHQFPKEWLLTEERKAELAARRSNALRLDDEKKNNGTLVDGVRIVEGSLPFMAPVAEPVMVGGPSYLKIRLSA